MFRAVGGLFLVEDQDTLQNNHIHNGHFDDVRAPRMGAEVVSWDLCWCTLTDLVQHLAH